MSNANPMVNMVTSAVQRQGCVIGLVAHDRRHLAGYYPSAKGLLGSSLRRNPNTNVPDYGALFRFCVTTNLDFGRYFLDRFRSDWKKYAVPFPTDRFFIISSSLS